MRRSMLYRLPHTGTETVLRKTALHEVHIQHKAKMVNFGGWSMPVQYSKGIVAEHKHTRNTCSVFDVSHMGQVTVVGPGAARFLEWLTPLALENLKPTSTKLSILMNENGGILDDIMVTKDTSDSFYMVVNATRFENDLKHMLMQREKWLENKCQKSTFEIIPHYDSLSLLAIQGPAAVHVLRKEMEPGIEKIPFMESRAQVKCFSNKVRITRCGYTGEDGFEISVANNQVEELLNALLNNKRCEMAGLGARDTLRLEAGLCLYGHELTETISPREAGLMWTIPKVRKETGGFIGFEALKKILASPLIKKRIGLAIKSGPPARQGATVCQGDATAPIGVVTSGSPSPTLGHNIAQAYIDPKSATSEHGQIKVVVREKLYDAQIVSLPFVPHNYFRGSV